MFFDTSSWAWLTLSVAISSSFLKFLRSVSDEFKSLINSVDSAFLKRSPTDLYREAFLACFSNSTNCSLYVCSISKSLLKLSVAPLSFNSASCLLLCKPLILAASSRITLLFSGLESII